MQEIRSIIALRNESDRQIEQPEHELDLSTIRTSRQTNVHSGETVHEGTESEVIGQDNLSRDPPFRRPKTLHLDPFCDRSKPGRCCNENGISNTASPKCKFCVENSNIFANLEESMRIVTHLRSIIQSKLGELFKRFPPSPVLNDSVKENCKHDKILQFDSSTWDRTPESVSQSDSNKQRIFDDVVRRRSPQLPQPENGVGYTDFDFVHSYLSKPSEPSYQQINVSDSMQNLALTAGEQSIGGSATHIVDDEATDLDNKNTTKRKNTLTISGVLFRNSDEDRDCNSRESIMKSYFRRTSLSRERTK
ncbi:hypothetical protein PHET_06824 [Paragonimus heterotremus]|uniref:Uncharacterized protein n=1 Tax=Paragonimus heterotremus TaxID=100268 RepID=A0A8J4SNG2_9TREM|nr:hypothetical protein PHET_06824 [Paragonimus heterotremus]